jgi:alkanesulfonate monooxygenase SsuD/methylene tetrahydromethanopterin reductase-like flavin-dependent oxidoreductase (luciferase family)
MPYLYTPNQLADSLTAVREHAAAAGRSDRVRGAIFCWGSIDRDAAVARRDAIAATSSTYQQDFGGLADRYLVTGTPAQVTSRLLEYRDAGADTVIFAGPRDAVAWRSCMDHLAGEVLPALRESAAPVDRTKAEVMK